MRVYEARGSEAPAARRATVIELTPFAELHLEPERAQNRRQWPEVDLDRLSCRRVATRDLRTGEGGEKLVGRSLLVPG
jgi:hypothetical protein